MSDQTIITSNRVVGPPGLREVLTTLWIVLAPIVLLAWLLDVTDHGLPATINQMLVAGWLLAMGFALGAKITRGCSEHLGQGLVLPALVLMSFVVRLVGLGWEAGGGYYRDEGIYEAAAQLIRAGELLPDSFIYGHFLFYLAAFVLWLQDLFPALAGFLTETIYGAQIAGEQKWIILRATSATMGALTTIPVFLIAERIAGRAAGVIAAFLIVFSPLYNEITHLLISDVPSAFFATLTLLFVARLVDRERLSDYLWAGVCAGLAAGSKYPAGVVAIAIVAVWLKWRIVERRWSWSLLWAGAASIGAFVAIMPALLANLGGAFAGEGRDVFFGLRQYGRGGWIGVLKESNSLYYGGQLLDSFKLPAVAIGLTGLFLLRPDALRRLFWNLAYPLTFLALMVSMNMAVKRNLLPAIPILAVVLAVGASGWLRFSETSTPRRRLAAVWVLAVVAIAMPMRATVEQGIAMTSVGTRELVVRYIRGNLPRGAAFVKESYTPKLNPEEYYWLQGRFAARRELDVIRDPQHDFLLLAWSAYGRFTKPHYLTKPHHFIMAERYQEMFTWEVVQVFDPGRRRLGPYMTLYRLHPETIDYRSERRFEATEASFLSGPTADDDAETSRLIFDEDGQWALFKGYFEAGRYRAAVATTGVDGGARLRVVTRDNQPIGVLELADEQATIEVPERDKLFLYVDLPAGGSLEALTLERLSS